MPKTVTKPAAGRKSAAKPIAAQGGKTKKTPAGHAVAGPGKVTSAPPMPARPHPMPPHPAQVTTVVPLPAPDPVISYFSQDTKGWLRAGEAVHVTMQGTPGGRAAFHVGTLSADVPMKEASPGSYVGTWVVPASNILPAMSVEVIGELRVGGKSSALMQTARPVCVDILPPTAQNLVPQPQTTVTTARPALSADLMDQGSGIDTSSIHLWLNGRDITGEAIITMTHLKYAPIQALSAGEQIVELTGSDRAGNKFTQTWRFTVAEERH